MNTCRIAILTQANYKITCFEMIDEVISMNVQLT